MSEQTTADAAVSELIDRYCAVWSEPSPARRAELLDQVWERDATYTDPRIHATGSDELLAHIESVLTRRPGAKVERTSMVDLHHGIARFSWHVIQGDGAPLLDGLDIAELSASGKRIRRIVGFFGPLRERESLRAPLTPPDGPRHGSGSAGEGFDRFHDLTSFQQPVRLSAPPAPAPA
jgi:hypothetical protein